MKKKKLIIWILVITFLIGSLTGCKGIATNKNSDGQYKPLAEKYADTGMSKLFIDLKTVDIQGNEVTSKVFEDKKLIMLNGWATWCGPCVSEIPVLYELAKEYDKGGEVLIMGLLLESNPNTGKIMTGLSAEERKTAEDILKTTGAEYKQLLVSEEMVSSLSKIEGFPTTFFVDSKGNLVGEPVLGSRSEKDWKKEISERLKLVKNE